MRWRVEAGGIRYYFAFKWKPDRMPLARSDLLALRMRLDSGFETFTSEVAAEQASSLGYQGRQVEKAMQALRDHDARGSDGAVRLALVKAAARQVWAFLVQRELCGLRDQKEVIRIYGIPPEVLRRLGAMD